MAAQGGDRRYCWGSCSKLWSVAYMDYRRENWALGLSSFGLILGPLGIGIGLYLASTSRLWSFGQKWAVVVIPAALVGIFWLVASPSGGYSCYQVNDEPEVC